MSQNISLHPSYKEKIDELVSNALRKIFGEIAYFVDMSKEPLLKGDKITISCNVRFFQGQSRDVSDTFFQKGAPIEVIIKVSEGGNLSVHQVIICITKVEVTKPIIVESSFSIASQAGLTDYEKLYYIQNGVIKMPKI